MTLSRTWRRWFLAATIVGIVVGAAALTIFLGAFERSVVGRAVDTPLTAARLAELVPKGRYIAAAADCVACHTAEGGAPWAGGRPSYCDTAPQQAMRPCRFIRNRQASKTSPPTLSK